MTNQPITQIATCNCPTEGVACDMHPLTNPDKIKAAWDMNYGTHIRFKNDIEARIIFITYFSSNSIFLVKEWEEMEQTTVDDLDDFEILGFFYLGQLGGNKPIERGQKFRVKQEGSLVNKILPVSFIQSRNNGSIFLKNPEKYHIDNFGYKLSTNERLYEEDLIFSSNLVEPYFD
jgi:hypothetical protein